MIAALRKQTTDLIVRSRKGAISAGLKGALNSLSFAGRFHPVARKLREDIEVTRNIRYREGSNAAYRLDIYKPQNANGPLPVVVYMHGGGFVMLSKDSHWMMGYKFAHMDCLVVSINYRLAPKHPFPHAMEDISHALVWIQDNIQSYGGDVSRLAYAGESAGANLALTSAICHSWKHENPFARRIWQLQMRPKALFPACGILQVSDPNRYLLDESIPLWMRDRIAKVCLSYLPDDTRPKEEIALASPLRFLELANAPERPFPPVFTICGTNDPILPDTIRLEAILGKQDLNVECILYPNGLHAFHAMVWHRLAEKCWVDHENFLRKYLRPEA